MAESSERRQDKAQSTTQKRIRPLLSCAQCHARKIKCDRVKPCGACCLRGTPEQCSLETSEDAQSYITQANEIKRLRKQVTDLESRVNIETSEGSPGSRSILLARSRSNAELSSSAFYSSFNQARQLGTNLSNASLAWAEQSFVPIHALSGIQMCPPDLSHFGSKASIDEAITSHFLEWVSPEPLSGARNWFRAVVEISSESDLLGPAVQAISSQFFALQCNDYALLRESQRLHVMTLAKLRQDIAEPSSEAGYFALYTTLLLVFYELASFQNPFSWMVHVGGAERIVKHLGPSAFTEGLPHDSFVLFSFFGFIHKVFQQKASFLGEIAWLNAPYSDETKRNDPYINLCHAMSDIPAVLEQAQVLHSSMDSPSFDPSSHPNYSTQLYERITATEARLSDWEQNVANRIVESPTDSTGERIHPSRMAKFAPYTGPTFDAPTTLCVFYSARLLLSRVDDRGRRASHDQLIQWAMAICQIAQDQVPHTRDVISAVFYLFTLRIAYHTLPEQSNGRRWIEGIFDNIATRFSMPLARSLLTHLPGPQGALLHGFGH